MALAHLEASNHSSTQLGADLPQEASIVFLFKGSESSLNTPSNCSEIWEKQMQLLLKTRRQISGVRCLSAPHALLLQKPLFCPCKVPCRPHIISVSSWEAAATCSPGSWQDSTGASMSMGKRSRPEHKRCQVWAGPARMEKRRSLEPFPLTRILPLGIYHRDNLTQVHKGFWTRLFTSPWVMIHRRPGRRKSSQLELIWLSK